MTVAAAGNGLDESDAFVIPQGMHAQAASFGCLLDRQGICHGRNGRSWSALQVKPHFNDADKLPV
jgi:hypothetical protein